jgi:hypothetical protein
MAEHDLTLSGEEVANRLSRVSTEIRTLGGNGIRWEELCRWAEHPNLPAEDLAPYLRTGLVPAWLNVSSPLMLLADPSLHSAVVAAVCSAISMDMQVILAKLRVLHPSVVEQVLLSPPPRIKRLEIKT